MGGWDLDSRLEMAMDALQMSACRLLQLKFFPEVRKEELPYAGFYLKNLISSCLMNPQTILMLKLSPGLNIISRNMKEQ
jgi:hypothetical protein